MRNISVAGRRGGGTLDAGYPADSDPAAGGGHRRDDGALVDDEQHPDLHPDLVRRPGLFGATFYGSLATTIILASALGTIGSGTLADRHGRRALIVGSLVLTIPTVLLFAQFTGPIAFLTGALVGLLAASTAPLLLVMAQLLMRGRAGVASGLILGLGFVTGAIGVPITGAVADAVGIQDAMRLQIIIVIVAIPLAFLLPERSEAGGTGRARADSHRLVCLLPVACCLLPILESWVCSLTMDAPRGARPRAGRLDQRLVVAVVYVCGMMMSSIDSTIVTVALVTLSREFNVTTDAIDAVVIAYIVAVATFIPAAGWLGDRFGTKRIFLLALTIFTIASALCGLAESFGQLVIFRAMQGAGAGMLTPTGVAMLYRTFPPEERVRVARVLMYVMILGPAAGPVLGGLIIEQLSWQWAFYVNIPVGHVRVRVRCGVPARAPRANGGALRSHRVPAGWRRVRPRDVRAERRADEGLVGSDDRGRWTRLAWRCSPRSRSSSCAWRSRWSSCVCSRTDSSAPSIWCRCSRRPRSSACCSWSRSICRTAGGRRRCRRV